MTSKGMVRFSGSTYRVVGKAGLHEVVRVLDDRRIGIFCQYPTIKIIESTVEHGLLLGVIREALRGAKLSSPHHTRWVGWNELAQFAARLVRSLDTSRRFFMRQFLTPDEPSTSTR